MMNYKGKRVKRRNPLIWAFILWLVAIACIISMVTRNAKADHFSEKEQVVMPEIEIEATESAELTEEEIEKWHRFCVVYRSNCPLSPDEQMDLFDACDEFNVDYFLMLGLIEQETKFRNIIGDGGESYGYCQVQPQWWTSLMEEIGAEDLEKPRDNFRTACAILKRLFNQYGQGNLTDVLTAYNSGHGGESEYARNVIANQDRWAMANEYP